MRDAASGVLLLLLVVLLIWAVLSISSPWEFLILVLAILIIGYFAAYRRR
jgi:hypothetical protein